MTHDDPIADGLDRQIEAATPEHAPPYGDVLTRRRRRRNRRRGVLAAGAAAAVVVVAVGIGLAGAEDSPPTALDAATSSATPTGPTGPATTGVDTVPDVPPEWDGEGAPDTVLQLDGRQVPLRPWSTCWTDASTGVCIDGLPERPLPDAGERDSVAFSFPVEGWRFQATFVPAGDGDCARMTTVDVEATGDYTFSVPPVGSPGRYDVHLFGQGAQGSVSNTFAWTTTRAGDVPAPSGYLALVAGDPDDPDELTSYGVELSLDGLDRSHPQATAEVSVTAANGRSASFGPYEQERGCRPDGTAYFTAPAELTAGVPDLGPAPFRYRVEVDLGGTTYVGTAVWPRDERRTEQPNTDLTFDPPLPAFTG